MRLKTGATNRLCDVSSDEVAVLTNATTASADPADSNLGRVIRSLLTFGICVIGAYERVYASTR